LEASKYGLIPDTLAAFAFKTEKNHQEPFVIAGVKAEYFPRQQCLEDGESKFV
jgi:hypothetical protein